MPLQSPCSPVYHPARRVGRNGRLTYTATLNRWEFAIYKYSHACYDPDGWFFPGAEEVAGILEGAMRAGIAASLPDRAGSISCSKAQPHDPEVGEN